MTLKIGILNGDDIGHEIVPAAVDVVRAAAKRHGLSIDWTPLPIGRTALDTHGSTMPDGTLEALARLDGWILGPIGHRDYPKVPHAINPHPILRKHFNLFANIRPTRSYPDIGCIHDNVDLVIVRENNEGFQPDRNVVAGSGEFRPTDEVTISVRVITRTGSRRVAKAALQLAQQRRKHLTIVHKNTVFKLGCGMFVDECRLAARDFPDVIVDDVIVDTFAMRLIRDPQSFDVVVTTNMFGDILSDEISGLVGGLGLAPGANIGLHGAIFEAVHGTAPDIAGKGIANPGALMLAGCMLLEHLGQGERALTVRRSLERVIRDGKTVTRDLGGSASTDEFSDAIIAGL